MSVYSHTNYYIYIKILSELLILAKIQAVSWALNSLIWFQTEQVVVLKKYLNIWIFFPPSFTISFYNYAKNLTRNVNRWHQKLELPFTTPFLSSLAISFPSSLPGLSCNQCSPLMPWSLVLWDYEAEQFPCLHCPNPQGKQTLFVSHHQLIREKQL